MDSSKSKKSAFITYDYKEVIAQPSQTSFLRDVYKNFGWQADGYCLILSIKK